jgi:hypothetical protein
MLKEKNTSLKMISWAYNIPLKLLNLYINDEVPVPLSVLIKIKKPHKFHNKGLPYEKQ